MTGKRAAFYTLGCKLNQYDTQSLQELFQRRGYDVVDFNDQADIYVINTCTVTGSGERKSRQMIHRAVRQNPSSVVVVTGCYAQTAPGAVADLPGVDLVIGNGDRSAIVDLAEGAKAPGNPQVVVGNIFDIKAFEELPITEFAGRTRATLKIQDGCNQFCTYCKIPYARGPSRSRGLKAVVEEARRLATSGFKEIVLTGIHLGAYGQDLTPPTSLAGVLRALYNIEGLERIRLGSVDAPEIDKELLETIRDHPLACHHLHIPLQAGDDGILKAMKRPYTLDRYKEVLEEVRDYLPGVAITTDIIVGFPGEMEEQFQNALDFVEEMAFTRLHVFRFSPRQGTAAARFPNQIPSATKQARSQAMIAVGNRLSRDFHKSHIGQIVEVLWEEVREPHPNGGCAGGLQWGQGHENDGFALWEGHTETYVKALAVRREGREGDITKISVGAADLEGIYGEIVEN